MIISDIIEIIYLICLFSAYYDANYRTISFPMLHIGIEVISYCFGNFI